MHSWKKNVTKPAMNEPTKFIKANKSHVLLMMEPLLGSSPRRKLRQPHPTSAEKVFIKIFY
jgi:hypothetical protein